MVHTNNGTFSIQIWRTKQGHSNTGTRVTTSGNHEFIGICCVDDSGSTTVEPVALYITGSVVWTHDCGLSAGILSVAVDSAWNVRRTGHSRSESFGDIHDIAKCGDKGQYGHNSEVQVVDAHNGWFRRTQSWTRGSQKGNSERKENKVCWWKTKKMLVTGNCCYRSWSLPDVLRFEGCCTVGCFHCWCRDLW